MSPADPYTVLAIRRDSTDAEIAKAYRKLALRYHPDRAPTGDPAKQERAKIKFQEISEAYQCLSDPDKRRAFHAAEQTHHEGFSASEGPRARAPTPQQAHHPESDPFQSHFYDDLAGDGPSCSQADDLRNSYFSETNDVLRDFVRWGQFHRNPRHEATATAGSAPPPPHGRSGWGQEASRPAGERLMEEAARCFSQGRSTNRGLHASGSVAHRSSNYYQIPIPPPDAQCASGHAAMGHVPVHASRLAEPASGPVRGYASPSSGECDDDEDDDLSPEPSQVIMLAGLTSESARRFNGSLGRVVERGSGSNRWRVQLVGNPRVFRLQPKNVTLLPCGVLRGLRTKKDLNGREVIFIGMATDGSNRYDCALVPESNDDGKRRSRRYCVHPKNVILGPGTRVDLQPRGSVGGSQHSDRRRPPGNLQVVSHVLSKVEATANASGSRIKSAKGWYDVETVGSPGRKFRHRANRVVVCFSAYEHSIRELTGVLGLS